MALEVKLFLETFIDMLIGIRVFIDCDLKHMSLFLSGKFDEFIR